MSDCCSTSGDSKGGKNKAAPRKFTCTANHEDYISVSHKTMFHHLKSPWKKDLKDEQYYFCSDPNCDVIYFGANGSVINKEGIRTQVGIKEKSNDALICYCFGVSKAEAKQNSEIKQFVTKKTKAHLCACDTRNPSGRCCLKDFPK